MTAPHECIICLEGPLAQNPLYLLACGCKVGWFHESCKNRWVDYELNEYTIQTNSLKCPACRRRVPFKTNYCFDWRAGPEQKRIWITGTFILNEICFGTGLMVYNVGFGYFIPLQSLVILCLPFVFNTNRSIIFYFNHIKARSVLIAFYNLTAFFMGNTFEKNAWRTFFHLMTPLTLQFLLLFLTHLQEVPLSYRVNPLFPFAISREVILASKCSALTAERDE
jgi:hypothetical protein